MHSKEIRQKYLDFFKSKGHAIIRSASLIPEDKTVLFNTAGMQPLVPYLLGESHPAGKRLANVQKCLRTDDIDEVGDNRHLTFFEMLGNWSLGDYFKEESIAWSFELLTSKDWFGIDPKRIYVTVFEGDSTMGIGLDGESVGHWVQAFKSVGIGASLDNRIYAYPKKKNWWELAGSGPCGPDTEIFYDTRPGFPVEIHGEPNDAYIEVYGPKCHINCDCGRFIEIWNNVFMEYKKTIGADGKASYSPLKQKNVDTGMGFERIVMVLQNKNSVFETDLFQPIIEDVSEFVNERAKRIIADHTRAIIFLISDGVRPSNKGAGYVLRRLCRRFMVASRGLSSGYFTLLGKVVDIYHDVYQELDRNKLVTVFKEESEKFERTLTQGLRELEKLETIDAQKAFKLFESFGLPYEVIKDVGGTKASNLKREDFDKEFARHQEISRAGAEKKFGGHGLILNTGEIKAGNEEELKKATRLHTATHLLQAALRKVLGQGIEQRGSDITSERTRFDFSFPRKLTAKEVKAAEDLVNEVVSQALPMQKVVLPLDKAKKTGALHFFGAKYPDEVNVYFAGNSLENAFSKEFCGGPHVSNTKEVGEFKIVKEEGISAGVRRIRADVG